MGYLKQDIKTVCVGLVNLPMMFQTKSPASINIFAKTRRQ